VRAISNVEVTDVEVEDVQDGIVGNLSLTVLVNVQGKAMDAERGYLVGDCICVTRDLMLGEVKGFHTRYDTG
jgi:hypothetical protein